MYWQASRSPSSRTFGFAVTLASGLLLGCAISLVETVDQPIAGATSAVIWVFLVTAAIANCIFGVCWAFFAHAVEPRFGLTGLVAMSLMGALALAMLAMLFDTTIPVAMARNQLGIDARMTHFLWSYAFYGSLYMAGYVGVRRAMRSREVLARVRLARDQSLAVLEEVRLEAFRRQLQPKTMLDALDALRAIYRQDPAKADDLLDLLVGFLRLAVRSVSAEITTVAAELELASRYLQLRSLTNGDVAELSFAGNASPPEISFPPGLLMPLIEQLYLAGANMSLHTAWIEDVFCAELHAGGFARNPLSEGLLRRINGITSPAGARIVSRAAEKNNKFSWTLHVSRLPSVEPQAVGESA